MTYLGESTPKLGFGMMRLPKLEDGSIDIAQTEQMVDAFLEAGLTYFDTARAYGESEDAVRRALVERHPRDSFTLATKVAPWLGSKNAEEAKALFDTSLEKTGAGYFDYYRCITWAARVRSSSIASVCGIGHAICANRGR